VEDEAQQRQCSVTTQRVLMVIDIVTACSMPL
jgi:hypothetical protein